ncbi:hypothetical protein DFJ77DRAFT_315249 [Powellomyces hirtus]|nr:hypothetical protein DFJ77DRAFT_315249 [Powellomyces hirtus]
MDALALSPTTLFQQEQHRRAAAAPCKKRKGYDDGAEWGNYKRMQMDSTAQLFRAYPVPAEQPFSQFGTDSRSCMQQLQQQHQLYPDSSYTQQQYPQIQQQQQPPPPFDHQALQAQLERHLLQLSPEAFDNGVNPHQLPPQQQQPPLQQDVYDFQDVHRKLLACGGGGNGLAADMMQMDGIHQTTSPPNMRRSASDMSLSPPPQHHHCGHPGNGNSSGNPVCTPMPSPQRNTASAMKADGSASHPVSPRTQRSMLFSMGYRKDCEKCRQGVPGHYMHVMNR